MDKIAEQAVIQYFHKNGLEPKGIHADMVATLLKDTPSYVTVKRWEADFKLDREKLKDDPCSGRPVTVATPKIAPQVHHMVMGNRSVTERYIS